MKVLFVGLGGVGQRHLRNLKTLLGGDLQAVAYRVKDSKREITSDLSIRRDTDIAQKYNIEVYYDLEEALQQVPEVAIIANPTHLHVPVALQILDRECHLFIEKPISHTLTGIDKLLRLSKGKNRIVSIGYQMRFHPCLQALSHMLREERLGPLMGVRAEIGEYLPGWHPYEDYRQMYASKRDMGGGVILSQIHELDYIYWLFGVPRQIFAVGGHLSRLEIDVEDVASILMECEYSGQTLPVHLHMDYIQRPPRRKCQIIGEQGTILVDLLRPSIRHYQGNGDLCNESVFRGFQRNQLFIDEMRHFLSCLGGREKPAVSIDDGVQSLRMALAALESLQTGMPVPLISTERDKI
jgi:predicted dehydrogenase